MFILEKILTYTFYLPVTGSVWHANGFTPLVVLTGPINEWETNSYGQIALKYLRQIPNTVIVYIESHPQHEITLAQISRLFAGGNIIFGPKFENNFYITSDVDLWPLNITQHQLPLDDPNKRILVTRPLSQLKSCCYRAIALSCVGMTGKLWRETINFVDCKNETYRKSALQHQNPYLIKSNSQNEPQSRQKRGSSSKVRLDPKDPSQERQHIAGQEVSDKISYQAWCLDYDSHNVYKEKGKNVSLSIFSRNKDKFLYNERLILDYMNQFFPKSVTEAFGVRKNLSTRATWFLDQSLIARLIAGWIQRHGGSPNGVEQVEYGIKKENRLNRGGSLKNLLKEAKLKGEQVDISVYTDAHLPSLRNTKDWVMMMTLLGMMVDAKTYANLYEYRTKFLQALQQQADGNCTFCYELLPQKLSMSNPQPRYKRDVLIKQFEQTATVYSF